MIKFRDEGGNVSNGFNVYPRKSSLFGFMFIWGSYTFACYRFKRSKRWVIGRLFI